MNVENAYRPPMENVDMLARRKSYWHDVAQKNHAEKVAMNRASGNSRPDGYLQKAGRYQGSSNAIQSQDNQPLPLSEAPAEIQERINNLGGIGGIIGRMRARMQEEKLKAESGGSLQIQGRPTSPSDAYDENGFAIKTNDEQQKWAESLFSELHKPTKSAGVDHYYLDKSNIPKENFLDEGIEQYRERYAALSDESLYATVHEERLAKSELDRDFVDYVKAGFEQAGLSEEDAAFIADTFSREFRMGMINGKSVDQSKLDGLRKLNSLGSDLIKSIQYSGYSFDFGV